MNFKRLFFLGTCFFSVVRAAENSSSGEQKAFADCMLNIRGIVNHYPHELAPLKKYIVSPCSDYSEDQKAYFFTVLKGISYFIRKQNERDIRTYSEKHFLLLVQDDLENKVPLTYERLNLHFRSIPY